MRRVASSASWAAMLLLVCACETLAAREPQPAVLTNTTAQSVAELRRIVSTALHGAPVRLAEDALTRDSTLIIDRSPHRDAAGVPLNGRALGMPEHFRLVKLGSQCILLHERTGERWTLRFATCAVVTGSKQ
jgi:hypothetical protein